MTEKHFINIEILEFNWIDRSGASGYSFLIRLGGAAWPGGFCKRGGLCPVGSDLSLFLPLNDDRSSAALSAAEWWNPRRTSVHYRSALWPSPSFPAYRATVLPFSFQTPRAIELFFQISRGKFVDSCAKGITLTVVFPAPTHQPALR